MANTKTDSSHYAYWIGMCHRLGIAYPELTEMQARAIFQAAVSQFNQGVTVFPEIMVPLIGTPQVCVSSGNS